MNPKKKSFDWNGVFENFIITLGVLLAASVICALIHEEDRSGSTAAIMIFVLSVLTIARLTDGYIWGIISSFIGVVVVNYIFTYPYYELNFTLTGYPLTFLTMLVVSIITSATSTQLKHQEELRISTEKEKIRNNLLRAISHDIRTPLTSIIGSTSLLLDENNLTSNQKRQLLEDVRDDGQWLIRVSENVLSITRFDGDTNIVKTPELAEELIETSIRKFNKRNMSRIPVEVSLPDEPVLVPMDIVLMEQVLNNLLENALIHGMGATKIVVALQMKDDRAIFDVINDGEPIPEYKLSTLFDGMLTPDSRFNSNEKRCMGIGLAVCKTVLDAHGGTISGENLDKNKGVKFTFSLPLEEEPTNEN